MSKRTILTKARAPRARLGLVALALALVLGLMAAGIVLTHAQSKNRILRNFGTHAAGSAGFVSTYVAQQGARADTERATLPRRTTGTDHEFESIVTSFGSKNAGLLDSSGRLLDLIPLKPAAIGTKVAAELPQVLEARSGRIGVSGVFQSVASGASVISIAAPFQTPQGLRVFAIGYPVTGSVLAIFVEHATAQKRHVVLPVDAKGNVIAASPRTPATTLQRGAQRWRGPRPTPRRQREGARPLLQVRRGAGGGHSVAVGRRRAGRCAVRIDQRLGTVASVDRLCRDRAARARGAGALLANPHARVPRRSSPRA